MSRIFTEPTCCCPVAGRARLLSFWTMAVWIPIPVVVRRVAAPGPTRCRWVSRRTGSSCCCACGGTAAVWTPVQTANRTDA